MKASTLPSLQSYVPNALQLARAITRAVSSVQVRARRSAPGTIYPGRDALKAMFTAANAALDAISTMTASLDVTPNSPAALDLSSVTTQQLVATRTKQDGTTAVVTGSTTWTSSDPTKATVSSGGLVTPTGVGSAVITGTFDGVHDSVTITIVA